MMLKDDFMDGLLERALHFAGPPGWIQFKGDLMVVETSREYGLSEQGAKEELGRWVQRWGGTIEQGSHDFGPPKGSLIRTANSTAYYLVVFLPESAVRAASPLTAAQIPAP
jgi:hypothetical protein